MRTSLVIGALMLFGSCAGVRPSSRCSDEASACLGQCPRETWSSSQARENAPFPDRLSPCEARCQAFAQECAKNEKKR